MKKSKLVINGSNYVTMRKKKKRRFPNYTKKSIPDNIEKIKTCTIKEAAKTLDLHITTVRYHIKRGRILAYKSHQWLVDVDSVDSFKNYLKINR